MISGTNWYGRGTTDIRPRFASRLSKTKTIHKTIADYDAVRKFDTQFTTSRYSCEFFDKAKVRSDGCGDGAAGLRTNSAA
jgi:hypothetical protein